MSNKFFKFKQFTLFHDKCAMKVGTDGVILGAWTNFGNLHSVLDIGTGTGLISLMGAQKNHLAEFTAIEIDENAASQAGENVKSSVFKDRIDVQYISLQSFVSVADKKYDLIVSNPPYFQNSLLPPERSRSNARHHNLLSLHDLLTLSSRLINKNGKLSFIYPADDIEGVEKLIKETGWHICRRTDVFSKPESIKPKRILFELQLTPATAPPTCNSLIIEIERHKYSKEYIELTKDFYLKM